MANETNNSNILTTALSAALAPGLLRNSIDERIVRIRPMSTPIDQISRCAGARPVRSMVVDYYSVDTKPTQARLSKSAQLDMSQQVVKVNLNTDNDAIFGRSETLLLPNSFMMGPGGQLEAIRLYVTRTDAGKIECVVCNLPDDHSGWSADNLAKGELVVRMGRAATELDVQTEQFVALPQKARNYCQIFK